MCGTTLVCGDLADPPGAANVVRVPARPGKKDIDDVLLDNKRVIVVGDDADLAAVVVRMMRREVLGSVAVGYVPSGPSEAAAVWGLPGDPAEALRVATSGEPSPMTLVRDDTGGVLLGLGVLEAVDGEAYCDDELALRGSARRVEVRPNPVGVAVRVTRGRFRRRTAAFRGRAFQYGGTVPIHPVVDGIRRERPLRRWTVYRHTEDLLLVQR